MVCRVGGLQQLPADGLSCPALEQHTLSGTTTAALPALFKNGIDALDKVQLLVGAGGSEILPVINKVLPPLAHPHHW